MNNYQKKKARCTPEQWQAYREKDRIKRRERYRNLTPEQKEKYDAKTREYQQKHKEKYKQYYAMYNAKKKLKKIAEKAPTITDVAIQETKQDVKKVFEIYGI